MRASALSSPFETPAAKPLPAPQGEDAESATRVSTKVRAPYSGTTCTDACIPLKASAGPSQAPESGEAFSCSRATATETCSLPAILLLVGSKPCQPAPGM